MTIKAIALRAAGTNCDYELEAGLRNAGFKVENVHVNELIMGKKKLSDYQLLGIPGGFSAGDYLGSGKVYANKLLFKLGNAIPEFIEKGNLVIGVCNGFQVLVKAGILPGFSGNYRQQLTTLTLNSPMGFQSRWVKLIKQESKCVFTSEGLDELNVPIAHGEGQFVVKNDEVLQKLYDNRQVVFKYEKNPNGSVDGIAGICDDTGRVFGLMPHPERNLFGINAPNSDYGKIPQEGAGMKIFRNAYNYFRL